MTQVAPHEYSILFKSADALGIPDFPVVKADLLADEKRYAHALALAARGWAVEAVSAARRSDLADAVRGLRWVQRDPIECLSYARILRAIGEALTAPNEALAQDAMLWTAGALTYAAYFEEDERGAFGHTYQPKAAVMVAKFAKRAGYVRAVEECRALLLRLASPPATEPPAR